MDSGQAHSAAVRAEHREQRGEERDGEVWRRLYAHRDAPAVVTKDDAGHKAVLEAATQVS